MLNDVDSFLRENTGRWAPSTQSLYARFLFAVSRWLEAIGVDDSSQVTTELLVRWLNEHDWGSSSRRNALLALRIFFRWAVGDEHSPAARIPLPKKATNSSRRALSPHEALELLVVPDTSTVKGKRDLAIVVLMFDTGLRASEVCNARMENLHLRELTLQVLTKGNQWEWSVFTEHTGRALFDWVIAREPTAIDGEGSIFISLGGPKIGTRLSSRGLWCIVNSLSKKAGIGHVCPHELRHSFAMLSLMAGASTRAVQIGGRWKDIKQVERYTQRLELEATRPHLPMNFLMDSS